MRSNNIELMKKRESTRIRNMEKKAISELREITANGTPESLTYIFDYYDKKKK